MAVEGGGQQPRAVQVLALRRDAGWEGRRVFMREVDEVRAEGRCGTGVCARAVAISNRKPFRCWNCTGRVAGGCVYVQRTSVWDDGCCGGGCEPIVQAPRVGRGTEAEGGADRCQDVRHRT